MYSSRRWKLENLKWDWRGGLVLIEVIYIIFIIIIVFVFVVEKGGRGLVLLIEVSLNAKARR